MPFGHSALSFMYVPGVLLPNKVVLPWKHKNTPDRIRPFVISNEQKKERDS